MNKPMHDRIYLLPEDGVWCWADRPAPGVGQSNDDAVEYVRADLFDQVVAQRDSFMSQLETLKTALDKDFQMLREHSDRLHVENCDIKRVSAELLAQVEQLKGIKPELPPFPPQGDGLPRFGIKWNGEYEPISTPMDDGYWTPYHLAVTQNTELAAEVELLAAFRDEVVGVMNNSQGVAGWHHNHTIATWDELFPVVPDIVSPAECLAQVKADVLLDLAKKLRELGPHIGVNYQFIEQRANSIRQGGAA